MHKQVECCMVASGAGTADKDGIYCGLEGFIVTVTVAWDNGTPAHGRIYRAVARDGVAAMIFALAELVKTYGKAEGIETLKLMPANKGIAKYFEATDHAAKWQTQHPEELSEAQKLTVLMLPRYRDKSLAVEVGQSEVANRCFAWARKASRERIKAWDRELKANTGKSGKVQLTPEYEGIVGEPEVIGFKPGAGEGPLEPQQ